MDLNNYQLRGNQSTKKLLTIYWKFCHFGLSV